MGIAAVANLYTWSRMFAALLFSQRRHLQKSIAKLDTLKSEGFLQALRQEVGMQKAKIKPYSFIHYFIKSTFLLFITQLYLKSKKKVLLVK